MLGIENEDLFLGKGISFCVSCDGAFYKNKDVAVIGGGNTAVTDAIYLSGLCNKVYIIYRGTKLKAESKLQDKLKEKNNIEVIYNSTVLKLLGNKELEGIIITGDKIININGMFLAIGLVPASEEFKDILDFDNNNYFENDDCMTKLEGVFVAGDVRKKKLRQVSTAVSDGALAATLAINYINE